MEIEHLILARDSSVDRDKNTMSVFEFLEDINIETSSPDISIPMQVVAVLKREAKEGGVLSTEFKFSASLPSGEEIPSTRVPVEIPEQVSRLRIRLNLLVPIKKSGIYKFRFEDTNNAKVFREISLRATLSTTKK